MLGDPLLRFSDHRAAKDLAERWRKERLNLMNCQDTLDQWLE
ncbi:hypothetical protein SLEP1_g55101 [Rubroshorea leprosula]|uniref:Uncharacterized protein n=1 Tax=Rubroshorea leprosula TaxID=152421 RepID=A0AAV5MGW8_9ROSI|nr:hypothetical protein SLEP1_g55101 [Rubroshorea leprosula]